MSGRAHRALVLLTIVSAVVYISAIPWDFRFQTLNIHRRSVISYQRYGINPYAMIGVYFVFLLCLATIATLRTLKNGSPIPNRYRFVRPLTLACLGCVAVVAGFLEIMRGCRLLVQFVEGGVLLTAEELRHLDVGSLWPVFGMALFTALAAILITIITISLQNHGKSSPELDKDN